MIHYRKSDNTIGEFDSDRLSSIDVKDHTFTITLKYYGYDEYDFWYEKITDVIDISIWKIFGVREMYKKGLCMIIFKEIMLIILL